MTGPSVARTPTPWPRALPAAPTAEIGDELDRSITGFEQIVVPSDQLLALDADDPSAVALIEEILALVATTHGDANAAVGGLQENSELHAVQLAQRVLVAIVVAIGGAFVLARGPTSSLGLVTGRAQQIRDGELGSAPLALDPAPASATPTCAPPRSTTRWPSRRRPASRPPPAVTRCSKRPGS